MDPTQGGFTIEDGQYLIHGQTWAWSAGEWTRLADGPKVVNHAMTELGGRPVLFGGDVAGARTADTWILRNRGWVELDLEPRPQARTQPVLLPVRRDRVRLFGGYDEGLEHRRQWTLRS